MVWGLEGHRPEDRRHAGMIRSRKLWPNKSRSLTMRRRSLALPAPGNLPGAERLDIARPVLASLIPVSTLAAMCAKDAGWAFPGHGAMSAPLNVRNGDASRVSACG